MLLFRAGKADKAPMLSAAIRMRKNKAGPGNAAAMSTEVPVTASYEAEAF